VLLAHSTKRSAPIHFLMLTSFILLRSAMIPPGSY
jgi:hypothetical protein